MRCKNATSFLQLKQESDSIIYTLLLSNTTQHAVDLILEMPNEQLDKVHLELQKNNNLLSNYTFDNKKISSRIYYDRNIAFPITLPTKGNYLLSISYHKNDIHNFFTPEVLIWKRSAKLNRMQALELTRGIFYGILALYIIISIYLYVLLKARNYLYYSAYLIAGTVYLFVKNNFGFELIWSDYPHFDNIIRKTLLSIYLVCSVLFLRGFLAHRIKAKQWKSISKQFIIAGIAFIALSFVFGLLTPQQQKAFTVSQTVFAVLCYLAILSSFIIGYSQANNRSLVFFTLVYFISFSFFLFYPQPEFARDFFGVSLGQIYTYSNAFLIAILISATTVYRVLFILRQNDKMKKQMSSLHVSNNYALVEGQYKERQRVGQELHDGIGVLLSAIKMKLSALKTEDEKANEILKQIIDNTDKICSRTRTLSHLFLPPTLHKFGIRTAMTDKLETYKMETLPSLQYNIYISDSLSFASAQVVYEILDLVLIYFTNNRPDKLQIRVVEIISIEEVQFKIIYTGVQLNRQDSEIAQIITTIELLNGKHENMLLNAWTNSFNLEFPVSTN